jgi:hypothetical protein
MIIQRLPEMRATVKDLQKKIKQLEERLGPEEKS